MKEPNLRPACGRAFLLQRRQNTLNGGGGGGGAESHNIHRTWKSCQSITTMNGENRSITLLPPLY